MHYIIKVLELLLQLRIFGQPSGLLIFFCILLSNKHILGSFFLMLMSLQEHAYIGLSEVPPSMGDSEIANTNGKTIKGLNFKATELRLGLPGSESPERDVNGGGARWAIEDKNGHPPLALLKNFVSGSKRGFSDTIDGVSGKWVLSGSGGSEADLAKNGGLFSPRGLKGGAVNGSESSTQQSAIASTGVKEVLPVSPKPVTEKKPQISANGYRVPPAAKAKVVGWPPIRSFRKNSMAINPPKGDKDEADTKSGFGCLYVKISMDGAPYLRKVDLKTYSSYMELSSALEKMFSCFTIGQCSSNGVPNRDGLSESRLMDLLHGSEYVLTYEDKDGDWMLVGDVPWEMFTESCTRLRIMKSSDAIGLAPRAMEKVKNRN